MRRDEKPWRIIIAGGGTGGHLFPGIAIAEELLRRNGDHAILFIGTQRGLEKRVLEQLGYNLHTLDVEGIKGRGVWRSLRALVRLPGSLGEARRIIKAFAPHLVIGVGGYA
ncbi:MAG: glycosyltransferase, partial [Syntrophales bacterium]|nr:glycosyltransferase [Syntrophales bacterium]